MARLAAGVRKRSDGTLEKRFTVNGRRYSAYGKNTKELTAREQDIRRQIEQGSYTNNQNITLDKYFEEWAVGRRTNIKETSIKTYRNIYEKHITKRLGNRKIKDIERREVLELQKEVSQKVTASTCNYVLSVLKIILNDAIRDEIIARNPADKIRPIKDERKEAAETYHRALTEYEQKVFMQELASHYYYDFIALLLSTGMRIGEAVALSWSDIDYKDNVIHVNKTLTFDEEGHLKIGNTTKTAAGKRDIPLNDTIKSILQRQRQKLGNIVPFNANTIFVSVYGEKITNSVVNKAIRETLDALEQKGIHIEHFTAHALRDTFATRFIEQGGNPQTLKTILGHSSLAMTMDLYSHVLPNTKQKEMDNLRITI